MKSLTTIRRTISTTSKKFKRLSMRTRYVGAALALLVIGSGVFGLVSMRYTGQAEPVTETVTQNDTKSAPKPADAAKPDIKPDQATTAPATDSPAAAKPQGSVPATPPAAKPAPKQAGGSAPATPAYSPTALRYIVPPQTARTTNNLFYYFDYEIQMDGTYPYPLNASCRSLTGPGKPNDVYCGSGSERGLGQIVVNPTAPDGIYTATFGTDIAYTRYGSTFQFEIAGDVVTILPGATVLPTTQF